MEPRYPGLIQCATPYNRQSRFAKVKRSRWGGENSSSDIRTNSSTSNQRDFAPEYLPLCPRQLSLSQGSRISEQRA